MKSILAVLLCLSLMSVTLAQNEMLQYLMMQNLFGVNRGRGQAQNAQAGQTGNLAAAAAAAAAARRGGAGAAAGGFGSLMGGGRNRGLTRMMAYSGQLGDTFRDMAMCDMLGQVNPGLRQMCMLRSFAM